MEEDIKKEFKEIEKLSIREKTVVICLSILAITALVLFIVEGEVLYFLLFTAWAGHAASEYLTCKTEKVMHSTINLQKQIIERSFEKIKELYSLLERGEK